MSRTKEEEMQAWKEEIPVSRTRRWVIKRGGEEGGREGGRGRGEGEGEGGRGNKKVLFFCGEEFDYSLFPKREEWQVFVETIPKLNKHSN